MTGVSNVRYGDVECLLLVSANASNGHEADIQADRQVTVNSSMADQRGSASPLSPT